MGRIKEGPDYGWLITSETKRFNKDGFTTAVGIMGPHNITQDLEKKLLKGRGQKFQLKKGSEVKFEGLILFVEDTAENRRAPLEDFGNCYSNCTKIEYV